MKKRNTGRYEREDRTVVQYPVTDDEELYQFHLCQWLRVPPPDRIDQQVWGRRIEQGKPQYLMGWNFQWHNEELLEPIMPYEEDKRQAHL